MIIGQDDLVCSVKKIFKVFEASCGDIKPHFFLTGGSGCGKTFTIKTLADKHNFDFMEINAASLTKEGMSGNSVSKALAPLTQLNSRPIVLFVDEFDKLFISGNTNSMLAHSSTNGVQNEFLKLLEADSIQVMGDFGKYNIVDVSKVLCVFSGAFNGEEGIDLNRLRELGVKTEFLGRVPLVYNAQRLTLQHLLSILSNNGLLSMYQRVFPQIKKRDVVSAISAYLERDSGLTDLGARAVNMLIHKYYIEDGNLHPPQGREDVYMTLSSEGME